MKLVRESIEFQRKRDPKRSLNIGKIKELKNITSDDLYEVVLLLDPYTKEPDEEYYKGFYHTDQEAKYYEDLKKARYLWNLLKDYIEVGERFDWKEHDKMKTYVEEKAQGRYVYNASPGMDDTNVIFSEEELPLADEVEYNNFPHDY